MQGRSWLFWAVVVAGAIAILALIGNLMGGVLDNEHNRMRLLYLVGLLALLGGSFFVRLRYDTNRTVGQLAIWVAIFAGFVLLYSFRGEFGTLGARLGGELMPLDGRVEGPASISFPVAENGHYRVRATADSVPLEFTVDTGATDVVLSPRDAERMGYNLDQLHFTKFAETANGIVRGAPIQIAEFAVGPILLRDLAATVNEADMSNSLLGMAFLSRLKSWRVENERLTLEQ